MLVSRGLIFGGLIFKGDYVRDFYGTYIQFIKFNIRHLTHLPNRNLSILSFLLSWHSISKVELLSDSEYEP